jgi:hypothetical protein
MVAYHDIRSLIYRSACEIWDFNISVSIVTVLWAGWLCLHAWRSLVISHLLRDSVVYGLIYFLDVHMYLARERGSNLYFILLDDIRKKCGFGHAERVTKSVLFTHRRDRHALWILVVAATDILWVLGAIWVYNGYFICYNMFRFFIYNAICFENEKVLPYNTSWFIVEKLIYP